MRDNLVYTRSSYLVSLPVLLGCLVLCVLTAFFGQRTVSLLLMFLAVLAGASRLWARSAAGSLWVRVPGGNQGVFPGEHFSVELEVRNRRFFPIVWLELSFPLAKNLCLVPEDRREPDEAEQVQLEEAHFSTKLLGELHLSMLLWYEQRRISTSWEAQCRGVYSTAGWRIRTGDGFGLTQAERGLPPEDVRTFYVYPRLIEVQPDLFLRSLWNADTGSRGVIEDPTVIRSTRDYMTTDSLKRINWRLAARGLPMTVNIYEDILPKSVHFLLDGESFSGPQPHLEELEEALRILASELVRLEQAQVRCGLSLCAGSAGKARNLFVPVATEELLCALAAYQPLEPKLNEEGAVVPQATVFDLSPILEQSQRVGRFYYIAYDHSTLSSSRLLRQLGHTQVSILTSVEGAPFGDFETVGLDHLKGGQRHG